MKDNAQRLLEKFERKARARAVKLPDDNACLAQMQEAYQRLKELGWNDAIYCPKDGTIFDAIEAGSIGIHDCHYMGEWPKGSWWTHEAGDLWPSRPTLYRLKKS
jgi:hypothetical protein